MLLFYAVTNVNLINIVHVKTTYYQSADADLFISDSNRISHKMVDQIRDLHLFRRVVTIPGTTGVKKMGIQIPPLRVVKSIIHFIKQINNRKREMYVHLRNTKYSHVFVPYLGFDATLLLNVLSSLGNTVHISLIEEGSGQLYSDKTKIYHFLDENESSLLWNYLHISTHSHHTLLDFVSAVSDFFLYAPKYYSSDTGLDTKTIPIIQDSSVAHVLLETEISNLDLSEYIKRKFIYFASAEVVSNDYGVTDEQLDAILTIVPKEQLIVKDHPRTSISTDSGAYSKYCPDVFVDQRSYLLESIYAKLELTDKVLITSGSATVLHPKYMFDKEPYVIFTYNISMSNISFFNDKVANDLRDSYSDKSKIFAPNTIEELQDILARFIK